LKVMAFYEANPEIQGESRWSLGARTVWFRSRVRKPFDRPLGEFQVIARFQSDIGPIQVVLAKPYAIVFEAKEETEDTNSQRWITYRGRIEAYMTEASYRDQVQKKARMLEICRALCGADEDMIALDADAMIHDASNDGAWMTVFTFDATRQRVNETAEYVKI
jgi:hypothetical protein